MPLVPSGFISPEWQPLTVFFLSLGVMLSLLASVEPKDYRPYMLKTVFTAFAIYWTLFATNSDFGTYGPYFGPDGIGDVVFFLALMAVAIDSLHKVQNHQYRRLIYLGRLDIDLGKAGPRLSRRPPLIESGFAKPEPLDE